MLGLIACVLCCGQSAAGAQPSIVDAAPAPLVVVDTDGSDGEDRGFVPVGSRVRRVVRFANRSGTALVLSVAEKSCTCVDATIEPAELGPGEAAALRMSAVVQGGIGRQRHGVVVRAATKSGEQSQRLSCPFSYTPDRVFESSPAFIDRIVVAGAPFRADVFIARLTPGEIEFTQPRVSVPGVRVLPQRRVDENPGLTLFMLSGSICHAGTVVEKFTVNTNSAKRPSISVPLHLTVLHPLRAEPPGVLEHGDGSSSASDSVTIRTVRLMPRSTESDLDLKPALATIDPPVKGCSATLDELDGGRLLITCPAIPSSGVVSTLVVVANKDGIELAVVPVLVFSSQSLRPE
ncbi:MAG: DUF1573 domain-containing protein [Phycisphaerales bacterium]